HVEAIRERGLLFESGGTRRPIRLAADTGADAIGDAELVLFCVKTRDNATAAREIAPRLRRDALVLSLQNGVDNVERLREAGIDALATVVYVGASMPAPGHLLHAGRGDLVVGEYPRDGVVRAAGERAAGVAAVFERAGVA